MMHALALAAFLTAQTADTVSTAKLLRLPQYHEANPLMPSSVGGIVAVKGLTMGAVTVTAWRIRHTHPRWATALFVIGTVSGSVGAISNRRLQHGT